MRVFNDLNQSTPEDGVGLFDIQILCPYADPISPGSAAQINDLMPHMLPLSIRFDNGFVERLPFMIGDKIVFSENIHPNHAYHGTLGKVLAVNPNYIASAWQARNRQRFSGRYKESLVRNELTGFMLIRIDEGDDKTRAVWLFHEELYARWRKGFGVFKGYAISVHKGQGSTFKRVIIPIKRNVFPNGTLRGHFIDRSMIYTALTRAKYQAVFIGDEQTITAACSTPATFERRQTNVSMLIDSGCIDRALEVNLSKEKSI